MTYWERLRKLGAFNLKRRFSTYLPAFFSYLRRGHREEGMRLFLEVINNRARDNGKKVTTWEILISYIENIFYCEGGRTLKSERLLREVG